MIIDNSTISFNVEHEKRQTSVQSRSFQSLLTDIDSQRLERALERIDLSRGRFPWNSQTQPVQYGAEQSSAAAAEKVNKSTGETLLDTRNRLFASLLNALTARVNANQQKAQAAETAQSSSEPLPDAEPSQPAPSQNPTSMGMRAFSLNLSIRESYSEYECTRTSSCGSIQTRDGQTFDFDLTLEMSRSYESVRETEIIQEIQFKDPLMVNFNGRAAELSEETYEFDIDADGTLDSLHRAADNSALLALDSNGDGIINDGSELFGALTGDGFAELAAYDEDANGFIDEADSIFDQLLLWNQGDEDNPLSSLAERGIGAIYLGYADTPFELKDDQNRTRGQVQQTGLYFTEEGEVGTVQQVDLAV